MASSKITDLFKRLSDEHPDLVLSLIGPWDEDRGYIARIESKDPDSTMQPISVFTANPEAAMELAINSIPIERRLRGEPLSATTPK